jgi:hypothetical protein
MPLDKPLFNMCDDTNRMTQSWKSLCIQNRSSVRISIESTQSFNHVYALTEYSWKRTFTTILSAQLVQHDSAKSRPPSKKSIAYTTAPIIVSVERLINDRKFSTFTLQILVLRYRLVTNWHFLCLKIKYETYWVFSNIRQVKVKDWTQSLISLSHVTNTRYKQTYTNIEHFSATALASIISKILEKNPRNKILF